VQQPPQQKQRASEPKVHVLPNGVVVLLEDEEKEEEEVGEGVGGMG
jgi:hypothetical protein